MLPFFTVIAKVSNVMELHDYRPVEFVGCAYKLLSKVLVIE